MGLLPVVVGSVYIEALLLQLSEGHIVEVLTPTSTTDLSMETGNIHHYLSGLKPSMSCVSSSWLSSLLFQTYRQNPVRQRILLLERDYLYLLFLAHDMWAELPLTSLECTLSLLGIQLLMTFHHINSMWEIQLFPSACT